MAIVTHASVQLDTLDSTVRRRWTNVPHCSAPMVEHQSHCIKVNLDFRVKESHYVGVFVCFQADTVWFTVTSGCAAAAPVSRACAARSTWTSAPGTRAQTAPPA